MHELGSNTMQILCIDYIFTMHHIPQSLENTRLFMRHVIHHVYITWKSRRRIRNKKKNKNKTYCAFRPLRMHVSSSVSVPPGTSPSCRFFRSAGTVSACCSFSNTSRIPPYLYVFSSSGFCISTCMLICLHDHFTPIASSTLRSAAVSWHTRTFYHFEKNLNFLKFMFPKTFFYATI